MKKLFTILFAMALTGMLMANNITISNLSLTGKNTGSHYALVQFDISWGNSWRTSTAESNWDAAWVFVKYRVSGGAWQHAWLNEDGHTAPAGSTLTPGLLAPEAAFDATTNPGLGAFIYRDANGTGTFTKTGVQLRWNYGANGLADGDLVEIKAFAIEMAYVPQGAFTVGTGGTESGSLTNGSWTSGATIPLSISSESALTIAQTAGNLWGTSGSGDNTFGGTGTLSADFPKGYDAFYCMKHEISQQGYTDFLNSLTDAQATARYPVYSTKRYGVTVSNGVYSTSNPYVACNFLSWADVAAYLDWSGLRPMTELEYEKACRGTIPPVAGEYAWGAVSVAQNTGITNAGAINETSTNSGNCSYGNNASVQGPMRVGAFAAASTTRANAGSTYYGIMEMSGNVWERTVTVGNMTGRGFTSTNGDGSLNSSGDADAASWPNATGLGAGNRGGAWWQSAIILRISDRTMASQLPGFTTAEDGGRGVRTQPFICGTFSITVNHVNYGGVAPVTKSVTYGTVSTALFGGTKCAITRNLGATNQASSATDASEASAGWYWQFNRKKGYQHTGATATTVLTPAWNAVAISEASDWTAANDPCTLELGSGWRIPTNAEWTNAGTNGSWGSYTDTYASVLKLHAAGYLEASNGQLYNRNVFTGIGRYWSSTRYADPNGYFLNFTGNGLYMSIDDKRYGCSVRCLKDLFPTVTTTAATSITTTTASSGGNVTDEGGNTITARGVCWGTASGPTTALTTKTADGTGTGPFTSSITGLASYTLYYVRAYATNSAGTSYGNEVSFTTMFECGTSLTKIHSAGAVAPVDKTVTYGTVSTTLFGGTKCAITQNLGASQQATAANDNTEASAGWYWQFNRKQGYKSDCANGSMCFIPSSPAWNTTNDNSSAVWEAAKDPCTIELGSGWRIPTSSEWTTADASWGNYNNTYSSVLKIHAAGYLNNSTGWMSSPGSAGFYWSSTQNSVTAGNNLFINSGLSYLDNNFKTYGGTLRCIKDLLPILTTTAVTLITNGTASSGGNITEQGAAEVTARGVCWSTTTAPTTALATKTTDGPGTGTFTSTITGLTAGTLYYVRAYATNSAGTAYGNELSFTTAAFICGTSSLSVNHITSDGIAPVDKLVSYGTVSTPLFGGTKCTITRNLGASQQATAATDATEASAGWYWQFNRKQGYKHDGTTLTPSWTITSINETSDWVSANDPCTLELGTGWRIPTATEWATADGSWANYTDTYNSVLKLHAAGYLGTSAGLLSNRGSYGYYWSSSQSDAANSRYLYVYSSFSYMDLNSKAGGFSIRCLKDLQPTLTTTAVTFITNGSAASGGNVTDDGGSTVTARGVCWSTSSGPTTALTTKTANGSGPGAFSSSITGLTALTLYYLRAYATSSVGTSYGNEVSFTTNELICGTSSLYINHVASGGVAPVDRQTTYNTISTTLFGGNKCIIKSNLGAVNYAATAHEANEACAGWYWQFNRKQGFSHTGETPTTVLTPPITITAITEASDWLAANDPCTLELGAGWRIPTNAEWNLADANGPWANVSDAHSNGALKIHAAGYVNMNSYLTGRGVQGSYWSSTSFSDVEGRMLSPAGGFCQMDFVDKAYALSVRCIKDQILTITTTAVTAITTATATSGGNVTDNGGSAITARGVCWSTLSGPVATGLHTTDAGTTGIFTSSITGLSSGTRYYVRAYATTSLGTTYGNEVNFTTSGCFVAGTKITMADGTQKNIEDILVGDQVKSVNTETMEVVVETVDKTFANPPSGNLSKITFSNGQTNTNTKNHPYWVVAKGWCCIDPQTYTANKTVSINLLAVGDQCLVLENGNLVLVAITAIEDQPELSAPTYNFKVNQTSCYFANGVLVHNKP
jgi:hypothetical protein